MATSNNTTDKTATGLPPDLADRFGVLVPVRLASLALATKLEAAKLRSLKLRRARLVARYGASASEVTELDQVFDARVAAITTLQGDAKAMMQASSSKHSE